MVPAVTDLDNRNDGNDKAPAWSPMLADGHIAGNKTLPATAVETNHAGRPLR